MAKKATKIKPIGQKGESFKSVMGKITTSGYKYLQDNDINSKNAFIPAPPKIRSSNELFQPDIQNDVKGMGVLKNGIPYLTTNGLGEFCEIQGSAIREVITQWNNMQKF